MRNDPKGATCRSRRTSRAAFTLLELMISLTVGGIALGSIYTIGAASTQHFREQQRVANTQTSLRMAMAQLKRDFQRAGFLGTPNIEIAAEQCAPPSSQLHAPGAAAAGGLSAISWFNPAVTLDATNDRVDPANLNAVTIADVVLMGNYSTSGEYSVNAPGGTLNISQNWQSFRRDFTNWYGTAGLNAGALTDAFVKDRVIRVHTLGERHWFTQLDTISTLAPISLGIVQALPAGCSADNGWVSPVNFIRYHVENAVVGSDEAGRWDANNSPAILRRTEVDPIDKRTALADASSVPIDTRSVLDYVVGFQLQFWRVNNVPTAEPVLATAADVLDRPETLRSVTITLSVRTPEEDPNLGILGFEVFPDRPGRARIRTLRSEIFLPNISFEGYPW